MNGTKGRAWRKLHVRLGIVSIALGSALLALSCAQVAPPQPNVAPTAGQLAPTAAAQQPTAQTPTAEVVASVAQQTIQPVVAAPVPTALATMMWPLGTATPAEQCALCHAAIYREYTQGFGADLHYKAIVATASTPQEPLLQLPADHPVSGTAHGYAGIDPWPIRARELEEDGKSRNVCHYPQAFDLPASTRSMCPTRAVASHLWTGSHSPQRLAGALHLDIVAPRSRQPAFEFHVRNIGAGHSVPTGSNRRAVYLVVDVLDQSGRSVANSQWMFAPNFADRPDDKVFVEADKSGPEPVAATQADAQGPHEPPVRAGEDRVLTWQAQLGAGTYTLQAKLIYDLNRYNDRGFADDQTEIGQTSLSVTIR